MLQNYLKIAWRNLLKNKTFSIINILGLAIGLATSLLITLYVIDELSYDRHNEKADSIYRINTDIRFGGNDLRLAVAPDPMGSALKRDYPQVEEFTRLYTSEGSKLVKKGSEYINEERIAYADSTFFRVFTLPALYGNTQTALNDPNTVVLSEAGAKKYLGTANAVGKIIEIDKTPYKVTAVIKNVPRRSHFNLDVFLSMDNANYQWGSFLSNNFQTYIVLQKGVDYKAFEKNFATVVDKYLLPQAKQFMQINSMDDFKKAGNRLDYSLMPLTDIHLRSDRFPELSVNGNIQYVYIFGIVALFVLLIACVNFMNLSTARSENRAKEVGIRKVLGTEKRTLIQQFLFESIITVAIALVIAIGLAALVLPLFNEVSLKSFTIADFFGDQILIILLLLPFVVGALAGIYPAFFLSRFQPIVVLKGNTSGLFKKSSLRSALVVFQFATSIILIIGTVIVYRQLSYIQAKDLGFNKNQVLIVNGAGVLGDNTQSFKNEVLGLTGVKSGTLSGYLPVASSSRNDNTFSNTSVMDSKSGVNMQRWTVDHDYVQTMGMQMVQGRNFSRDFPTDSSAVLINETAANLLGFSSPIGKKIYTFNDNNEPVAYEVVGVIKNFHFESLRQNIGPLCMMLGNNTYLASFKVEAGQIPSLVKQIEEKWKKMAPGMPFSYRFLDESFNEMYRSEQRVGKIAITFAVLAIAIACLGLFGLATYTAERRIKEIGIRKVLGATITNIINMLSMDFLKLVAVAAVVAFPLAWWAMNQWLQDFHYRTQISWWVFAFAGLLTACIALLTVSFQALRAALSNPVKSLRTE